MTVAELIAKLQMMPQDLSVVGWPYDGQDEVAASAIAKVEPFTRRTGEQVIFLET